MQKSSTASRSASGGTSILDLTAHAQALATRDEQGKVGAALDERRKLRRRLDHLLQVVE